MAPPLIWPTLALVALIFVVWVTLFVQRFAHMKANPPTAADFATAESSLRYFAPAESGANNFRNLFEMPVLYFALVPLLIQLGCDTGVQAVLAWVYVVLRVAHSFVHISRGKVMRRFAIYLCSCIVLSAMWIGFAVDLIVIR